MSKKKFNVKKLNPFGKKSYVKSLTGNFMGGSGGNLLSGGIFGFDWNTIIIWIVVIFAAIIFIGMTMKRLVG